MPQSMTAPWRHSNLRRRRFVGCSKFTFVIPPNRSEPSSKTCFWMIATSPDAILPRENIDVVNHIGSSDVYMRAKLGEGLEAEFSAGYLYKYLDGGEGCPRQIVEYSKLVYGFQCHMEFN